METHEDKPTRYLSPKEWYRSELSLGFHDTFDLEVFDPTTDGFIEMAEDETEYAARLGVRLRPMDVALFLIDWWRSVEMHA